MSGSPGGATRSYTQTIDLVQDIVGSDIPRDLLRVAIVSQDVDNFASDISTFGGQAQSAVDVAARIDAIHAALASQGGDSLRVALQSNNLGNLTVDLAAQSVGNLGVDLAAQSVGNLGVDLAAQSVGNVGVEQQTPVGIEDSTGTQIDPLTQAVLASVAGDQLRVDIENAQPTEQTNQIAAAADISGGVSQKIDKRDFTVYVENTGSASIDISLAYSPDGATSFFPDPDVNATTVSAGGTLIVEVGYDATHVEVSGSNTEPCDVHVVQR